MKLNVTRLAKWKTTMQMFAVGFLLAYGAIKPIEGVWPLGFGQVESTLEDHPHA